MGFSAAVTEALNPIRALGTPAKAYARSVVKSGMRTARSITNNALGHGLTYYAAGGAVAGGAIGGYDDYSSGGNGLRGALKGAAYGAAGGAALRLGMSAMSQSGRRSLGSFGARLRGMKGGLAGGNYFGDMRYDFLREGGFSGMRGLGRNIYGRARTAATRAANSSAGGAVSSAAATAAGRAAGAARGAYGWAKGGGVGATAAPLVDKAMYYTGL